MSPWLETKKREIEARAEEAERGMRMRLAAKAGGVYRTFTLPTFNRRPESARPYEHSP
jgi:hypothetical protein